MIRYFLACMLSVCSSMAVDAQKSEGLATYYDNKFEGRPTSSGEIFTQSALTAAHRNLPYGTKVKVTNLVNKKSVTVRINDRGPFVDSRIIDLSEAAARELDFITQGVTRVSIEVVDSNAVVGAGNNSAAVATKAKTNNLKFPNENYEIDIKFVNPSGFVVQVGSFTELANLLRMSQELQRVFGKNLIVQVSDVNEKKVHRLLVGPYPDRASAEAMQLKLKQNYPECFVLGL